MPLVLRLAMTAFVASLLAACSPTVTYNKLALAGVRGIETTRDIPYGDDPRLKLDVYAPPRGDARPKPVLVFLYGGSWDTGEKNIYGFVGAAFSGRGFVTVIPDYRLVPAVRYPGFLEDGAQAVRWARDNARRFGGDPERIVLVGHSAGAYNAAMIALDPRWLQGAGVPRSAIKGWAGLAGPYDFLPLDVRSTREAFGQAPDLPSTQPINHVSRGDPPTFLATGVDDATVEPEDTRELARRLQAAGVPVETQFYPKVGHIGIVTAIGPLFRGRAPVLTDLTRFLQERTSAAQPPSA